MQSSSPIAAMRSQSIPFGSLPSWGQTMGERISQAGSGFGFQDHKTKSNHGDYFRPRPRRIPSPTANLATDLSRNFHLDSSPMPPTPRRSLFGTITGNNIPIITPPLITTVASPTDSMEFSPLPHKPSFSTTITVQAATPVRSPSAHREMIMSSPLSIPESPLVTLRANATNDRRRLAIRPSLTRTKGYSISMITGCKSASLIAPPPFRFGNITLPRTTSLDESFVDSPQEMSFSGPFGPPLARRPQSSHQRTNSTLDSYNDAFLSLLAVKKTIARPRKQVRRSLSMYQHPVDVFHQQEEVQFADANENAIAMDLDTGSELLLPHFFSDEDDALPRIKKRTMTDILDGKYAAVYDEIMVIDCRFEYEYEGGHIDGALNFNDKEELATRLFHRDVSSKTLLVFHCEYSAHRAPIAAKYVRGEDRNRNAHQYPQLSYPEVYILDGGYSSFFKEHSNRCYPQDYVEMNDKRFISACERGMDKLPIPRTKMYRAATFTFGAKKFSQESPCGPPRMPRTNTSTDVDTSMDTYMDYSMDSSPVAQRSEHRRMVTY